MDFVRRFSAEAYSSALKPWNWLPDLSGKQSVLTSAFGAVFLQGEDGAFWLLDTFEGTLTRLWPDAATPQSAINAPEGQDQYLIAGLVGAVANAGLTPGPEQVLGFEVMPVLGG
jgi:hypothetical protein